MVYRLTGISYAFCSRIKCLVCCACLPNGWPYQITFLNMEKIELFLTSFRCRLMVCLILKAKKNWMEIVFVGHYCSTEYSKRASDGVTGVTSGWLFDSELRQKWIYPIVAAVEMTTKQIMAMSCHEMHIKLNFLINKNSAYFEEIFWLGFWF